MSRLECGGDLRQGAAKGCEARAVEEASGVGEERVVSESPLLVVRTLILPSLRSPPGLWRESLEDLERKVRRWSQRCHFI